MQSSKLLLKKNDLILFGIIIIISLSFLVLTKLLSDDGSRVYVYVNDSLKYTFSLNEDIVVELEGLNGTNTLEISQGRASIISASCPDKLCVHQRSINKSKETIVCLPNKLIVLVEGEEEAEYDGYTN